MIKKTVLIILSMMCFMVTLSAQTEKTVFKISDGMADDDLKTTIETSITNLLQALSYAASNEKTEVDFQEGITKTARECINEMWKSSAFVCSKTMLEESCLNTSDGYQIRNIPITMLAADEGKNEQEIVIDLNKKGWVDNISIAIDAHKYKEIMQDNQSVTDLARRQVIVNFVENFRTAYNRKDMNYLQQVYSDNALVITGHIVKEQPLSDSPLKGLGQERIVYQKQSKQEYLSKLALVFKLTKYLNVMFSDIEIIQHPKYDDIYGVTLKQDWNTNRYKDEGYLFLMIDFKDELRPLIQVRTWQPYRFEGKVLSKDEVFSLGSFNIVR